MLETIFPDPVLGPRDNVLRTGIQTVDFETGEVRTRIDNPEEEGGDTGRRRDDDEVDVQGEAQEDKDQEDEDQKVDGGNEGGDDGDDDEKNSDDEDEDEVEGGEVDDDDEDEVDDSDKTVRGFPVAEEANLPAGDVGGEGSTAPLSTIGSSVVRGVGDLNMSIGSSSSGGSGGDDYEGLMEISEAYLGSVKIRFDELGGSQESSGSSKKMRSSGEEEGDLDPIGNVRVYEKKDKGKGKE